MSCLHRRLYGDCRNVDLNSLPVPVKPEHIFFMNNSVFSSDPAK